MRRLLAWSLSTKTPDNQLALSLLTTSCKLVIIKPEQAMRTHPDIGLMSPSLVQFWLCTVQAASYKWVFKRLKSTPSQLIS